MVNWRLGRQPLPLELKVIISLFIIGQAVTYDDESLVNLLFPTVIKAFFTMSFPVWHFVTLNGHIQPLNLAAPRMLLLHTRINSWSASARLAASIERSNPWMPKKLLLPPSPPMPSPWRTMPESSRWSGTSISPKSLDNYHFAKTAAKMRFWSGSQASPAAAPSVP